jgi:glycosyltransferase involved in cell wall biosynthesis
MATGCAIVGSDTAPVREFMTDGENGLLANFFDTAEIADRISEMLDAGSRTETMRVNARGTIRRRWSADIAMGRHGQIVGRLLGQPK